MPEVNAIARGHGFRVALSIRISCRDSSLLLHLAAELPRVRISKQCEVGCGSWRGVHEDHSRNALGVPQRIFQRKNCAPGMAEQRGGFQMEMPFHPLDIFDIRYETDLFRPHSFSRLATPPLVVVDEPI